MNVCNRAAKLTREQTNKYDKEECDDDGYQSHQNYDFAEISSFVSLFTGNGAIIICQISWKCVATDDLKDAYEHFIIINSFDIEKTKTFYN